MHGNIHQMGGKAQRQAVERASRVYNTDNGEHGRGEKAKIETRHTYTQAAAKCKLSKHWQRLGSQESKAR